MSRQRKTESSSNSTVSIRSSYFQTESAPSDKSDRSTVCSDSVSVVEVSSDESFDRRRKNFCSLTHKNKLCTSVQINRNIIGEENSSSRERPGWVRPPVVGQASSNDDNSLSKSYPKSKCSSESEEEIKPQISNQNEPTGFVGIVNRSEYVNEKPLEGISDQSLPLFADLQDFQRVPTPPSSISSTTPKPLEWDSGADVGYFQAYGCPQNVEQQLSTIERMALDQGRSGILVRSEPEGRTSCKPINVSVLNNIGVPTSESTPILSNDSRTLGSKTIKTSQIKKKENYIHLFPEVIIETKGNESDSSAEHNCKTKQSLNKNSSHNKDRKLSASLENLSKEKLLENQAATFPRSQSQLTLGDDGNSDVSVSHKKTNPPPSVSSSSLATVVTGSARKSTKSVQTSCLNTNAGTQSSFTDKVEKCDKSQSNGFQDNIDSSTLESIQISTGDRVNSFEYLPGHVYENVQNPDQVSNWEKCGGFSLRNDIERGVQILQEFIQGSNANNTIMKKELIKRVVKRLVLTDYPEDSDTHNRSPQRCLTRRSQNRDNVVGESSSENISEQSEKPTDVSTTLSGQSTSTTWQSTSESSKTSDPNSKHINDKVEIKSSEERTKRTEVPRPTDAKPNWKMPVTRTEKLYEERRKGMTKGSSSYELLDFLNSERENHIDWIVKEINHLSNLKTLLEKHERLKKNLNKLKKAKQKNISTLEQEITSTSQPKMRGVGRKPLYKEPNERVPTTYTKRAQPTNSINEEKAWDSHNYETDSNGRLKKTVSTETRKEDFQRGIRSTAYTITFEPSEKPKEVIPNAKQSAAIIDRQTLAKKSKELVRETYRLPSLQDYLVTRRPDIVSRAETRRKTIAELAAVRQLREEKRPVVLATALSCDSGFVNQPPPSLVKRVVSQKEMRQQTEKKYRQTFEVKKKVSDQKLRESHKTNRLMKDIFNKRLQMLTLKGHTNLSNSLDVISTV